MKSQHLPTNPSLYYLCRILENARHWLEYAPTEADAQYISRFIVEIEIKINELTLVTSYLEHCMRLPSAHK
jgi:hypothetical protein